MPRRKLSRPNYVLRQKPGERFYLHWTENGQHRALSTGRWDRAGAEAEKERLIADIERAASVDGLPTINEILDHYLADRKDRVEAYATLEHSVKPLRRHLGALYPNQITRLLYWDRRAEDDVSAGTIIREGVTLRAALALAAKDGLLMGLAPPAIDLPARPAPRDQWLTREQGAALIEACRSAHMRLFVILALQTGARTGAILSLTWDRVDLKKGLVHFKLPGRAETKKRRATVPLTKNALAALNTARELATIDHVIEYGSEPVASIKKAFERAAERAGVPWCTPHVLRHTAATWMVEAGVDLGAVARMLGDSEAMIEKVYGKHSPDYLREAASALDGVVKAGPKNNWESLPNMPIRSPSKPQKSPVNKPKKSRKNNAG